jgi:hypothetical protein
MGGDSAMNSTRLVIATALATALTASAHAQQQQGQRLSGTIEKVDGNTVHGKATDGSAITVKLANDATVTAVYKATIADIKPGAYIGSGAIPQPDGSQKALEVHIFQKPQADGGHHYSGWYGAPSGTMTNGFVQPVGTVGAASTGGGEPSFLVKYHDGEKRIVVPANAHIVRYEAGSKDDLKAGAAFRVTTATKEADGTYTTSAISVGKDGGRPF